jgi:hypothetical protein
MGAKRRMRSSMPTRWRASCGVACCPRPLSIRPRGGRGATGFGAGCHSGATVQRCCPRSSRRTVRITCPRSARTSPIRQTERGGAERFPEPAIQNSITGDRTRLGHYARLLTARERAIVNTAQAHNAQVCSRLRSSPGVGTLLALVLLYDMHDTQRLPRVQEFVSSGRLVSCAKASAGKR